MSVNFRQLEVFCSVAEHRSFTRASHALFISQSTVSQHIQELEELLQVRLFHRTRRQVSLSSAGEMLLSYGKRVFQLLEEAESSARSSSDPYAGKLEFGCASTTLLYQLPPILAAYARDFPQVEINVTGGTIQEVSTRLIAGDLDLALVVLPLKAPGLHKVILNEEPFVAVVPAKHKLARASSVTAADLATEPLVLHRAGQNTRRLIDRFFWRRKITPRVSFELAETEVIKEMVAHGLGISLLPASSFPAGRPRIGLRTIPIAAKDLRRTLAMVHPQARMLRPAAAALAERLQKALGTPASA